MKWVALSALSLFLALPLAADTADTADLPLTIRDCEASPSSVRMSFKIPLQKKPPAQVGTSGTCKELMIGLTVEYFIDRLDLRLGIRGTVRNRAFDWRGTLRFDLVQGRKTFGTTEIETQAGQGEQDKIGTPGIALEMQTAQRLFADWTDVVLVGTVTVAKVVTPKPACTSTELCADGKPLTCMDTPCSAGDFWVQCGSTKKICPIVCIQYCPCSGGTCQGYHGCSRGLSFLPLQRTSPQPLDAYDWIECDLHRFHCLPFYDCVQ
jgi:hypothetical protein